MSDGYEGARQALTAAFQRRTLRTVGRSPNVTSACGLSLASGSTERAEGRDQERGQYTLTLPGDTAVTLEPGEHVTIDEVPGRVFVVVWAPPASNLRLSRRYGLNEVR